MLGTQISSYSINRFLLFSLNGQCQRIDGGFGLIVGMQYGKIALFKVLLKALAFAEWLPVSIPRIIKLVSASRFMLSSILLAKHCSFIETFGKAWITWGIKCFKSKIKKTTIPL